MTPFLTLYTPTYRRPHGLARCLASVSAQTIADDIEQIVIPDHIGRGIGGMYAQVPYYVDAVHGQYVAFLCDDDVLATPSVVEELRAVILDQPDLPAILIVRAKKGAAIWPADHAWPTHEGCIDLNCAVVRADVWKYLARQGAYGQRYEGDFDFFSALARLSLSPVFCDVLLSVGAVSHGAAEEAAA